MSRRALPTSSRSSRTVARTSLPDYRRDGSRFARSVASGVALFVVITVFSSVASAGGMFLPARGARALGRGGAFTAGVDDGSAIYYNTAGMADIDGDRLL